MKLFYLKIPNERNLQPPFPIFHENTALDYRKLFSPSIIDQNRGFLFAKLHNFLWILLDSRIWRRRLLHILSLLGYVLDFLIIHLLCLFVWCIFTLVILAIMLEIRQRQSINTLILVERHMLAREESIGLNIYPMIL